MSRPKLDLPLKEHNSPRSQWISNVSLLKGQLKDGEFVDNETDSSSKLSWNELEAKLSKRMKDPPAAVSPNKTLATNASRTRHNGSIPVSPNNVNVIHHPNYHSKHAPSSNHSIVSSKRPTLKIPSGGKSRDILKQVHSGISHTPILSAGQRSTSPMTLSKKPAEQNNTPVLQRKTPTKPIPSRVETDESTNKKTSSGKDISDVTSNVESFKSKQSLNSSPASKSFNESTFTIYYEKPTGPSDDSLLERQNTETAMNGLHSSTPALSSKRLEILEKEAMPVGKPPYFFESKGDASVMSFQATGSFAMPRRNPRRDQKTKGSLSWLRRALKSHDTSLKKASSRTSHVTPSSTVAAIEQKSIGAETTPMELRFKPTTPLQLGLWLTEIRKTIRVAQYEQKHGVMSPMNVVDSTPVSPKDMNEDDDDNMEDLYYKKNRDVGVYVDYSTFDDGDSVSSLELLFKWLTCRDLNETDHKRSDSPISPPGTVMATESNVSDELSIDMDAKPTRRTFFAR